MTAKKAAKQTKRLKAAKKLQATKPLITKGVFPPSPC
jgi:hypothetical protein